MIEIIYGQITSYASQKQSLVELLLQLNFFFLNPHLTNAQNIQTKIKTLRKGYKRYTYIKIKAVTFSVRIEKQIRVIQADMIHDLNL